MRNCPYFLECGGQLNAAGWRMADHSDAEAVVAEQPRRLTPEETVRFQLPVEDGEGFGAAVDFNGDGVPVFADSDKEEEVGHDLQLGGAELLAQLPVGQGSFELEVSEPGDNYPGFDDGEVVFEASAGSAVGDDPLLRKVGLRGRSQAVHVLLALFRRQDCQVLGVEETPEADRGSVPPYPVEGVRYEVRGFGQPEASEGVEYGRVTLGELGSDAAAAAMTELAASRRGHGRSGFLTGRPQVGHGV